VCKDRLLNRVSLHRLAAELDLIFGDFVARFVDKIFSLSLSLCCHCFFYCIHGALWSSTQPVRCVAVAPETSYSDFSPLLERPLPLNCFRW